jgi:hypothetical protein
MLRAERPEGIKGKKEQQGKTTCDQRYVTLSVPFEESLVESAI